MFKAVYNIENIDAIAKQIIEKIDKNLVLFNAEMGAGKTTLIKALCKQLGAKGTMSSPSFSIVNEYFLTSNKLIYHFDFYRINDPSELFEIGIDDYISSKHLCFIEWPNIAKDFLPKDAHTLCINILDEKSRELIFL